MKLADIRAKFLAYFQAKGHTIVPSSPVVPGEDPTLLFTNAGMNQFKDVFLGLDKRSYIRAASSQKCIRAGGKHNDLENVGYTARHHTFFEMLGNFSFGDYFKKDAIVYAWELLTQEFGFPAEKLWVTVYQEDDEAYNIWAQEIKVPPERIVRIGDNKGARYASDNFWMMGDTGPCGPCSEIFYDHGEGVPGGPPGSAQAEGDRYIEIWNNVFMQYNRDEAGVLHPLPRPSVDTGMGLERLAAVLQGVHSNYEIDLFVHLIAAAQAAVAAAGGRELDAHSPSLKVIADHIRACAFIVADGVIPGNEGRGYVLRRIARRAIRHGYKLGARQPFFYTLVAALAEQMGEAYPELIRDKQRIADVLQQEESRFFQTIAHGMDMLEQALASTQLARLDGELAFKLHDTYGFPLDLTADICRERGVAVDEAGFNQAMNRQREQARAAGKFKVGAGLQYQGEPTAFHGYTHLVYEGATVTALYVQGASVPSIEAGDDAVVVLDHTPFYAESGGQVGDVGFLQNKTARFDVEDTQKIQADVYGHHGRLLEGRLSVGERIDAKVNTQARARTMRNHSATHLLHKALREVLGDHVTQKGSHVDAQRTRFDFSHDAALAAEHIQAIEARVNAEILRNEATQARVLPIAQAQKLGAMMLFGEKYGDEVRVMDIGSSRELCGGTHVQRTGDIGLFKIVAETGVAAGVRRVEAMTGDAALAYVQTMQAQLDTAAATLKVSPDQIASRIAATLEQIKGLEKELGSLKGKFASNQASELADRARDVQGIKVLATQLDGADAKALRDTLDQLKSKLKSAAIVLASVDGNKVQLAAGVTADATAKIKAGELVNFVAQQVGGKGGGRADMAMAGGTDPKNLAQALSQVVRWVQERL